VAARAVHGPGRRAQGGGRAGVLVALQELVGERGRLLEGLGVGQALGLGGQLGRLPHPDLGGVDLVQLVAEQVDLAFALAGPGPRSSSSRVTARRRRQPAAKADRGPSTGLAGVAVEQVALDAGAEQVLELVLAVHLDQGPDDVGDPRPRWPCAPGAGPGCVPRPAPGGRPRPRRPRRRRRRWPGRRPPGGRRRCAGGLRPARPAGRPGPRQGRPAPRAAGRGRRRPWSCRRRSRR
jgi:hypothetical protein